MMSQQSSGTLATLLVPNTDVALQLRWAARLAAARKLDLLLFHREQSTDTRVVEVSLEQLNKSESLEIVNEVLRVIQDSPELCAGSREIGKTDVSEEKNVIPDVVQVRFKIIYFENLVSCRRTLLDQLQDESAELFTQARSQLLDMSDVDLVKERKFFIRYIPCNVVLCSGLKEGQALQRILVATQTGPQGKAVLQLARDLASLEKGSFTALHVNPDIGGDAERVGERRLDRLFGKVFGPDHQDVSRRVVVDDHVENGIRRVWEEGGHDMVMVGASGVQIERSVGTKIPKGIAVVTVINASPFANRFREFIEEGVQRFVPQIERNDRVALVDRVQSSAAWNFDFTSLMVLSTVMAAAGLIQNSAAVVIGAMLVAPLMTPLLGIGLALVQGNPVLARLSLQSVTRGICVSLLGGFLVGLFTLSFDEPTREMLARGGPGLLDLCVAFAAGLAAAYASSRPGLIAALPGVAIAAALVPPIATSGLALSIGDFSLAAGALLLFVINMVTIILASMTSLWLVGLRNLKKTSRWTTVSGGVVLASVMVLGLYLGLHSVEYELADDIPPELAGTVQKSLGTDYHLEDLAVAYDELGLQLNVQVAGKDPVREDLATEVRTLVSDLYKKPVRVRLLNRIDLNIATTIKE